MANINISKMSGNILFTREAVTHPAFGQQEFRLGWIALKLSAQTADVYPYVFDFVLVFLPPDALQQIAVGEHNSRISHQHMQQLEFNRSQFYLFPTDSHQVQIEIERNTAALKCPLLSVTGRLSPGSAAKDGSYTC